jgi:hypothetical protein
MQSSFLYGYFVYDGIKVVVPFKTTEGYKHNNQDEPDTTFLTAAAAVYFATGY